MTTIARRLYDDHLVYLNEKLKESDEDMLLEFRLGLDFKDVLQFALAGAAEYGLDLTVAGAPASFAADTAVDVLFAGSGFMETLTSFGNLQDQFQQGKEIMERVFASREELQNGFEAYYDHIQGIWSNIEDLFPSGVANLRAAVALAKQEVKKGIDQVAKKIAEFIGKAIKIVIPDATIGAGVAVAIKTLLLNLSENSYSVLTNAINRSSTLTEFLTNPETAKSFFERMYDGLVSFLQQIKTKVETDSRWSLRRGLYGIIGGGAGIALAASPIGQQALVKSLSSAIGRLRSGRDMFLRVINGIFDIVIPALFGLLATQQILMKNDIEDSEEGSEDRREDAPAQLSETILYSSRLQLLAGIKT